MKYLICDEYGCVYWFKDGNLWVAPQSIDGTFDTEESTIPERPHDEIPEEHYDDVLKALGVTR